VAALKEPAKGVGRGRIGSISLLTVHCSHIFSPQRRASALTIDATVPVEPPPAVAALKEPKGRIGGGIGLVSRLTVQYSHIFS